MLRLQCRGNRPLKNWNVSKAFPEMGVPYLATSESWMLVLAGVRFRLPAWCQLTRRTWAGAQIWASGWVWGRR
jgi:hypothetical protein